MRLGIKQTERRFLPCGCGTNIKPRCERRNGENMSQIICKNVALGYDGRVFTSGLNFTVEAEDYLCIVGENGVGKSTLIKAVLRLKPPISGEITMGDGVISEEIGYLPQQTEFQRDFPASVREIVISGFAGRMGLRPFYTKQEKSAAERCMRKLGIFGLANRCYRELSGGQQQRVLLARALCSAKKMILLDEPTSGLDPVAMQEMYAVIHDLNVHDGMTVIMVSHDIESAAKYSKHILHLGSEQLFFGTTEEYLKSDTGKRFLSANECGK